MELMTDNRRPWIVSLVLGCCILTVLSLCGSLFAGDLQPGVAGLSRDEVQQLGERIYRDGILPSGKPVQAVVQGDLTVEGTQFSCANCHMRSGLGSYEGQVVTPPINGIRLYQPRYRGGLIELSQEEWARVPRQYRSLVVRPAYSDETLAAAIRGGVNAAGVRLAPIMPRYQLGERDMAILTAYLRELSSVPAPGVTDSTLHFATVIAGEVSPEDRAAALVPLERYMEDRNNLAQPFEARRKSYGWGAENMDRNFRRLSLSRWELKGAPETWRGQLEEYYRKEPVFALLGGISYGDWKPVHQFSEDHRIPCIMPVTDYPVISEGDWYTLYFSKGLYQEGEAAARFLALRSPEPGQAVLEVVQDTPEGRAVAAGFEKTWQSLGKSAPVTRTIGRGAGIPADLLEQHAGDLSPPVLLLWTGPETLSALAGVPGERRRPASVYISSSLMRQGLLNLPNNLREFTFITYPYALPQDEGEYAAYAKEWLSSRKAPVNERRISTRAFSLMTIMTPILMHLKRDFYRDNLLDVIGMLPDQLSPDYERLSFGPGQQYASKGCYIVQLSQGAKPQLVKKSGWVVQ